VEDHESIRAFIRECFHDSYVVYEAANGLEGFEIAKEVVPDVIISDIMMPVMDGISFCKAIKAEEITSHIPIILLTARTHDSFMIKGLETGAEDYIVKPFREDVLKLKVENLIKTRKLLRQKFSKQLVIKPFDISVDSENEVFLKKAIQAIEDNMASPQFGVDDFCEIMAVSYIQLYRKFQGLIGQSPTEFIKTIRLQRAAQLLSKNRYSVGEVSDQVGFNDPSYFIRSFKKHFGKTPKDFAGSQDIGVSEKRNGAPTKARGNFSRA
jgi:YesN/AraC family two-component response regulator